MCLAKSPRVKTAIRGMCIVTLVTDGMVHTYRDGKAISRKHMHEKWFFITTTYYVNHIKCASSINYQDDVIDKRKDGLQFSK